MLGNVESTIYAFRHQQMAPNVAPSSERLAIYCSFRESFFKTADRPKSLHNRLRNEAKRSSVESFCDCLNDMPLENEGDEALHGTESGDKLSGTD
jgi:hypothetical protein